MYEIVLYFQATIGKLAYSSKQLLTWTLILLMNRSSCVYFTLILKALSKGTAFHNQVQYLYWSGYVPGNGETMQKTLLCSSGTVDYAELR